MVGQNALDIVVQIARVRKAAAAHKRACVDAEADVLPPTPVIEIVAGFEPLLCEVGDLVPLEPKLLQIGAGAVVESCNLVGIGQFAVEIVGVNGSTVLGGERIHGDV